MSFARYSPLVYRVGAGGCVVTAVTVAALVIVLTYPSPGNYHNYNHGAMFATEKVEGDSAPLFTKGEKLFTDQQTYAYREYRSKCQWRQSTVGKKKNRMCYQKWTRFQSIMEPAPFECSDDLVHKLKYKNFSQDPLVLDCESRVDVNDDNSDVWRIQRIGPFYGGVKEGAYEWHNIIFHDPTDLKKVLRKGAELYITGSYLAIVDQVGDQISDYHAQLHNCQLYTGHLGEDFFERHGGRDCMNDPSGAKCLLYLELFPKGYGVKVDRPMKLSCTTHHILNERRGSDDNPFYYEIALRTTHRPQVPITRGGFVLPGDPWSIEEMRYIVPVVPSVKWATFRNPTDQYLWFYSLQTNLSLMDEVWLFTTAADNIGLNQEPFTSSDEAPWQPYPLFQDKGMSTQTAKTHIMQQWEKRLRVLGHPESQEQKELLCSHLIRQWGLHLASVGAEAQGWREYREDLKDPETAGRREALCLYVMDHLEKYLETLERPALERTSFDVAKEPVETRRHFCEFLMKDWHLDEGRDAQTAETLEQQQELCMFAVAHREELRDAEIPRQQERMCRLGFSDAVQMMPPDTIPSLMKAEDRTLERGHHCLSKLSGDWKQGDVLTIIAFSDPKVLYEKNEGEAVQHTAVRALSHQYGHAQRPWMCMADSGAQPDACLDVLQYGAKYLCRWNPKWTFGGAVHCPSGVLDRLMMEVRNNIR